MTPIAVARKEFVLPAAMIITILVYVYPWNVKFKNISRQNLAWDVSPAATYLD